MKKRNNLKIGMMAITLTLVLAIPAFAAWVKLGPDVRITNAANWSEFPSLVWTGTEYGVSWTDNRDGNYEIYFARIYDNGAPIIPTLSEYMMILMGVMLLAVMIYFQRFRRGLV